MEDSKIIELFFNRSEQAIRETEIKYGRLCHNISYNILCDHADADECVNDTYLHTWNAIPPQRPNVFRAFLCKIARNAALNRYYYNTAEKRDSRYTVAMDELGDCIASCDTTYESIEENELTRILENFLDKLSVENRVIFLRRYWFSDSYEDIAARVGITKKNVSVRLTRLRKQLKDYLNEKGVYV